MICPACSEDCDPIGVDIAPPLAICPACETSLVLDETAGPRLARSSDTAVLSDEQSLALKKLRKKTRSERAAYYAAHH